MRVSERPVRIGIVVGEASGDILGAGLMDALIALYPNAKFEGIGGERMLAKGFHSYFEQDRLAVMGLIDPLMRLPELLRMRRFIIEHFTQNPPDLFIGIDSPDFNLTIEERLRSAGIKTVHYVSPSVWAWRQKRVIKIARAVDLMLTLLPFEAEFYRKHDVPVCFVGHPLADELPLEVDQKAARQKLGMTDGEQILAVLPGSRAGEVKLLIEPFIKAAVKCHRAIPDLKVVIPAANRSRRIQIEEVLQDFSELPVTIVDGQSHTVMASADVVMMASGTTTLEAALLKKPMVVGYRLSRFTYWLLSRFVKTRFFSLPNLIADRELVPERLQSQVTPEVLAKDVLGFFNSPSEVADLKDQFYQMHQNLKLNASDRAAAAISELIEGEE